MRFPLGWAKDFVDLPDDMQAISDRLTLIGYMTEHIDRVRPEWREPVSAKLIDREPSGFKKLDWFLFRTAAANPFEIRVLAPHAFQPGDKLDFQLVVGQVASVKQQKGEIFEITLNVGSDKPAVAMTHKFSPSVGSKWATLLVGSATRGAKLASEADVGYTTNSADPVTLPDYYQVGKPLATEMTEVVYDLEVRQNRADCLGVVGLCRDLAAALSLPFKLPAKPSPTPADLDVNEFATLSVEAPDLCRRFCIQVICGVKIGPSPRWLADRVTAGGMRSINNVVDITNYVMLESGQPLHAFDYDRLDNTDIIIRRAGPGERMPAIDEKTYELTDEMLVVANRDKALALAGVIGGKESEINDATVNILLDAAHYNQTCIRRTSRKLQVRTEASTRLEKFLDVQNVVLTVQRATQMILELAGGHCCAEPLDYYKERWSPHEIDFEPGAVNALLGTDFSTELMCEYLDRLEFQTSRDNGRLSVRVPSWRSDVTQAADVAEEVARVHGYEKVPAEMLSGHTPSHVFESLTGFDEHLRDILIGLGLDEVITDTLTDPDQIERAYDSAPQRMPRAIVLANPPSKELKVLRTDLVHGLLETVMINHRAGRRTLGFFEIGKVFAQGTAPNERMERRMMAAVLAGAARSRTWTGPEVPCDVFHAKGLAETVLRTLGINDVRYETDDHPFFHPGRCGKAVHPTGTLATFGQLHPRQRQRIGMRTFDAVLVEFDVELLDKLARPVEDYNNPFRHEALLMDLSVVVDRAVPADRLCDAVAENGGEHLRSVRIIDLYQGEQIPDGKKSLTFSLRFQTPGRTLQQEEVLPIMKQITSKLDQHFGATIRS